MDTYKSVEVNSHHNGVIRIYGNGGLLFEVKGEYVRSITIIDPQPVQKSGEAKVPDK